MASCYDCIHSEVCSGIGSCSYHCSDVSKCKHFKNKADVVEVVRCEKCKHGEVSIISRTTDGEERKVCYCNVKNAVTDLNSYCPSGERGDEDA